MGESESQKIPLATTRYFPLAVKRALPLTGTVTPSGRVALDAHVPRAEDIAPEGDIDIEFTIHPDWDLIVYGVPDIEPGTRVTVLHENGNLYAKPEPKPSSTVTGEIEREQGQSQQ